jgi:hypothetical protein
MSTQVSVSPVFSYTPFYDIIIEWPFVSQIIVFIGTTSKTVETVINTKHFTRITRQFQNQPPIGW